MTHTSGQTNTDRQYVGRFAPSPSGPLHFGSLVAALGSYLQARHHKGKWLVRIEDIDPPREVEGADTDILNTLRAFGLNWDDDVLYQSQRHQAYEQALLQIAQGGRSYRCTCTRKRLKTLSGGYDGHCAKTLADDKQAAAIRFANQDPVFSFNDLLLGKVDIDPSLCSEDFVIHRKDGLFAYQLAVVVDDIYQGVTEVVRGADLLDTTPRQIALYNFFGKAQADYVHLPLIMGDDERKLSKQNHAAPVDATDPLPALRHALKCLGQACPDEAHCRSPQALLQWAIPRWSIEHVPHTSIHL